MEEETYILVSFIEKLDVIKMGEELRDKFDAIVTALKLLGRRLPDGLLVELSPTVGGINAKIAYDMFSARIQPHCPYYKWGVENKKGFVGRNIVLQLDENMKIDYPAYAIRYDGRVGVEKIELDKDALEAELEDILHNL